DKSSRPRAPRARPPAGSPRRSSGPLRRPAPGAAAPPTLSLHDALPIFNAQIARPRHAGQRVHVRAVHIQQGALAVQDLRDFRDADRKSTRLNSSHVAIPYAVFCLEKRTGLLAGCARGPQLTPAVVAPAL